MKIVAIKVGANWYRAEAVIQPAYWDEFKIKIGFMRPQTHAMIFLRHNNYAQY